jgi:hypothetical protein
MKQNELILVIGVVIGAILIIRYVERMYKPRVIFTCTTFFDFKKRDRWATFQRAIRELQIHDGSHLPTTFLIVNEYSETPREDWTKKMATTFPYMTFIQKTKEQKGQAASLNIILDRIKPYDYWIQWEDSWFPDRPFLARGYNIMNTTTISQLQITRDNGSVSWTNKDSNLSKTTDGTEFIRIDPSPQLNKFLGRDTKDYTNDWIGQGGWPLFSLQPSINRVSDIYTLPYFSNDPVLWPVKFEWDFARHWILNGNTKAVLPDGPVLRKDHVSTYA